jgi:hypothetical protein
MLISRKSEQLGDKPAHVLNCLPHILPKVMWYCTGNSVARIQRIDSSTAIYMYLKSDTFCIDLLATFIFTVLHSFDNVFTVVYKLQEKNSEAFIWNCSKEGNVS